MLSAMINSGLEAAKEPYATDEPGVEYSGDPGNQPDDNLHTDLVIKESAQRLLTMTLVSVISVAEANCPSEGAVTE